MVERKIIVIAAILALKTIAQEYIEACERRVAHRFDIGFEANNRWQFHFKTGGVHGLFVLRNNIDPIKEHRLDGVLPAPNRQRVITQRAVIRVEYEGWTRFWVCCSAVHVACSLLRLSSKRKGALGQAMGPTRAKCARPRKRTRHGDNAKRTRPPRGGLYTLFADYEACRRPARASVTNLPPMASPSSPIECPTPGLTCHCTP